MVLLEMRNQKSPDSDGFYNRSFQVCFNDIKVYISGAINQILILI